MTRAARRAGLILAVFVATWLAAAAAAHLLFGCGNSLVWLLATAGAAIAYLVIVLLERRAARTERPS